MFLSAFIAFSITGVYFYLLSGNFLLYPTMEHVVFLEQFAEYPLPQAIVNVVPGVVLRFQWWYEPTDYIFLLLRVLESQNIPTEFNLLNFSDAFYVIVLLSPMLLLRKVKKGRFFVGMFVFYVLFLTFFFTNVQISNGKLVLFEVAHAPMYATVLTLPAMVLIGIASEKLLNSKGVLLKAFVAALVLSVIVFGVIQLNYDMMIYRNTIYDVHALINYVEQNPNETYYAHPYIARESDIIMGNNIETIAESRPVSYMTSCNLSYIRSISNETLVKNLRFVSGGALPMDVPPMFIHGWDVCMEENLAAMNYSVIYNVTNPSPPYDPLKIWAKR